MKNVKLLIIPLFAVALLLSLCKVTAHAEEVKTQTVKYHNEQTFTSGNYKKSTWDYEWEVNGYSLYAYTQDADTIYFVAIGDTSRTVRIKDIGTVVHERKDGTIVNSNIGTVDMYVHTVEEINTNTDPNYDYRSYNVQYNQNWQLEGVPLFDSISSLRAYVNEGDESGWLNKPEVTYDTEHDFSNDTYSVDIPVPEISQINHKGFALANWQEGLYVDVIVENRLLEVAVMHRDNEGIFGGLKSEKYIAPSSARTYGHNYWNFTTSNEAFSQAVIDIQEMYGADVQGALVELFKRWSQEHPKINTLSSYDWTMIGYADSYIDKHVYKEGSGLTDEQQLRNSGQAETTYYIRYYNKDGVNGQWAKYRLNDYKENANMDNVEGSMINSGTIAVDPSGKTEVTGKVEGEVDKNSGYISYTPYVPSGSISVEDMDLSTFKEILTSLVDSIGEFPTMISKLFGFLPTWLIGLLAVAIVCCILLRVLGR